MFAVHSRKLTWNLMAWTFGRRQPDVVFRFHVGLFPSVFGVFALVFRGHHSPHDWSKSRSDETSDASEVIKPRKITQITQCHLRNRNINPCQVLKKKEHVHPLYCFVDVIKNRMILQLFYTSCVDRSRQATWPLSLRAMARQSISNCRNSSAMGPS